MEQIEKVKGFVRSQLPSSDLQGLVQELTGPSESWGSRPEHEAKIKEALAKSGLIDELSKQLTRSIIQQKPVDLSSHFKVSNQLPLNKENEIVVHGEPLIRASESLGPRFIVEAAHGRAFLSPLDVSESSLTTLELHLLFQGQRVVSASVSSATDPKFNLHWEIPVQDKDVSAILSNVKCRMHAVVIRRDGRHNTSLVGVASVDMRNHILENKSSLLLEIKDIQDQQLTVGLVDLRISQNFIKNSPENTEKILFKAQKEEALYSEKYKFFLSHARQWWNDYLQIRASHEHRLVKIFVHTESGKKEPVTNYVSPSKMPWLVSPRHAARYVSLIPQEKTQDIGVSGNDFWPDIHTFLALGKGDIAEHAILLCNLLLGFSMDAYVTLGTNKSNDSHMWVTVVDSKGEASFWESLTGQVYTVNKKHQFRTPSDSVDSCQFKFHDPANWKELSKEGISSVRRPIATFPYREHALAQGIRQIESDLQAELKQQIGIYREDHDMSCLWDENLSYLLGQSLWRLEMSKVLGDAPIPEKDFEMGILRCIPEGHTFKGYPMQFQTIHAYRIFQGLVKTKSAKDILLVKGDKVRFGLRVCAFEYGEHGLSVWVMICARFKAL